jgi:hypothetical protein
MHQCVAKNRQRQLKVTGLPPGLGTCGQRRQLSLARLAQLDLVLEGLALHTATYKQGERAQLWTQDTVVQSTRAVRSAS